MNDYNVIVGKIISKHRKARKITQRQLAERLNCGRSTISNIERGDIGLGVDSFSSYCIAIGEDPVQILREILDATRQR